MYTNSINTSVSQFLDGCLEELKKNPNKDWEYRAKPDKWSKKEILGHLIDSAQNNIRRLIVSQYQQNDKIIYDQEAWVKYNDYQAMPVDEIIQYWYLINKQYYRITLTIPVDSKQYTVDTGKATPSFVSLDFLINDYWGHQQHHLRQIGVH